VLVFSQSRRGLLGQLLSQISPHFVFLTITAVLFSSVMMLVHCFCEKPHVVLPLVFLTAYGHIELTARYGKGMCQGPPITCAAEVMYVAGLQLLVIWFLRQRVDRSDQAQREEALLRDLIHNAPRNTLGFDVFDENEARWDALDRARNELLWSPASSVSFRSDGSRRDDDWEDDVDENDVGDIVRFDLDD
jgi:hypothetical protein